MKHYILSFFINQYEVEEGLLNDLNNWFQLLKYNIYSFKNDLNGITCQEYSMDLLLWWDTYSWHHLSYRWCIPLHSNEILITSLLYYSCQH